MKDLPGINEMLLEVKKNSQKKMDQFKKILNSIKDKLKTKYKSNSKEVNEVIIILDKELKLIKDGKFNWSINNTVAILKKLGELEVITKEKLF